MLFFLNDIKRNKGNLLMSEKKKVNYFENYESSESPNIYKYSKIFVLPTFSENFGLVIAEALSYGLPTITTKGTPWSSLEKANAGWWCEASINEFENVLKVATNLNENDYKIMSQNAYNLSKSYDWDQISKSYLELYNWILYKTNKPSFIVD